MVERFNKTHTHIPEILMMCLLNHMLKVVKFMMLKLQLNAEVAGKWVENVGTAVVSIPPKGRSTG